MASEIPELWSDFSPVVPSNLSKYVEKDFSLDSNLLVTLWLELLSKIGILMTYYVAILVLVVAADCSIKGIS